MSHVLKICMLECSRTVALVISINNNDHLTPNKTFLVPFDEITSVLKVPL